MDNALNNTSPGRRIKKHLTSGNLWIYVLSLIKKNKKLYAYTLNGKMEKKFKFKSNRVMIYLVLYRLENEKLIESEFKERRKYYKITKKGSVTLDNAKKFLKKLSEIL